MWLCILRQHTVGGQDVKVKRGGWLHALENCSLWDWPLYVLFGPELPSPVAAANTKVKLKTERKDSMKNLFAVKGAILEKWCSLFYRVSSLFIFHLFIIFCNVIDQTYHLYPSFYICPPFSNHRALCPVSFHNHSLCCLCTLEYVAFTEDGQPNRDFILQAN